LKPSNWFTTTLIFSKMPIEIKELHIKINVDEKPRSQNPEKIKRSERDDLIAACVEQVLEILSKKEER
jgi:hypothetical protein